jgi:heterodisulfide reductase subunit B
MKLAYYPGCVAKSSGKEYDRSLRAVSALLGIELLEVPDWNCCGATHVSSEPLAVGLAARVMSKTDQPVMTGCSICYSNLRLAALKLVDNCLRSKVNSVLDKEYTDTEVRHILEVIVEAMKGANHSDIITRPLNGLKVAPYYGCLLTRPPGGIDSPENPMIMERFIEMLGAEPVSFSLKMRCCGGPIFVSEEEAASEMAYLILRSAKKAGADLLAVACPLCHLMLDCRQRSLEKRFGESLGIPVLYVTQLAGVAFGLSPEELGLDLNSISAAEVLGRVEGAEEELPEC